MSSAPEAEERGARIIEREGGGRDREREQENDNEIDDAVWMDVTIGDALGCSIRVGKGSRKKERTQ